jgi:hypothetical protein
MATKRSSVPRCSFWWQRWRSTISLLTALTVGLVYFERNGVDVDLMQDSPALQRRSHLQAQLLIPSDHNPTESLCARKIA